MHRGFKHKNCAVNIRHSLQTCKLPATFTVCSLSDFTCTVSDIAMFPQNLCKDKIPNTLLLHFILLMNWHYFVEICFHFDIKEFCFVHFVYIDHDSICKSYKKGENIQGGECFLWAPYLRSVTFRCRHGNLVICWWNTSLSWIAILHERDRGGSRITRSPKDTKDGEALFFGSWHSWTRPPHSIYLK